jgi:hypothetical protein
MCSQPTGPMWARKRVRQKFALSAKLGDGAAEIDGIPKGNGGDRKVETGGAAHRNFSAHVVALFSQKQNLMRIVCGLPEESLRRKPRHQQLGTK